MKELIRHKKSSMVMNDFDLSGNMKVKELPGVEGALTMAWLDHSIIVGTLDGYIVISITDGNLAPTFLLLDSSNSLLLKCFPKYGELLLLVDNVAIVVNVAGQPMTGSLFFKYYSNSVGKIGSYVVVEKHGKLELYHKATSFRVQSLSLAATGHVIVAERRCHHLRIAVKQLMARKRAEMKITEGLRKAARIVVQEGETSSRNIEASMSEIKKLIPQPCSSQHTMVANSMSKYDEF